MNATAGIPSVIADFLAAQMAMGKAIKNATNPHLKNRYADLTAVMDAALPALHEHGFALIQPSGADERGPYVDTILLHKSGERLSSRVHLIMSKQDMQALGSAQTYARRYGLLGMAGLTPEDDDGNAASQRQDPPARKDPPKPAGPTPQQIQGLIAKIQSTATLADLEVGWGKLSSEIKAIPDVIAAKDRRKAELSAPADTLGDDFVPF